MDGTYGQHGHHEEHSSDGTHGHEAAHDLEHVRGEGLPADVPADFSAVGNPTKHYGDDEHAEPSPSQARRRPPARRAHGHGKGMSLACRDLMAVPLYLWNFAPHPFKPGPGEIGHVDPGCADVGASC